MKTIEEHNKDIFDAITRRKQNANKTGVRCPKCIDEVELLNINPGTILLSSPPQIRVHCPVCDYRGNLYVEG